jgi:Gpi18-like mannosyltransferase
MDQKPISTKTVIVLFVLWIIITQSFSWLAFNRLRITESDKKDCSPTHSCPRFDPHPLDFLEMHARQDSAWYFSIAYEGYKFSKDEQSNVNFFPLYPTLMKYGYELLKPLTPNLILYHQYLLSGTLISIFSLFFAIIFLWKLFRLDTDSKTAFLAIFFLLVFPTSYFLTAIYTESLFLLLAVCTFYFARKNQFILAGLAGYFAALSRPVGIFLLIPVLMELIFTRKRLNRKELVLNSLSLLLYPLGLATFMYYLNQKFGDPLLFVEAAKNWGRSFTLSITFPFDIVFSLVKYIGGELDFTHASAANIFLELIFFSFGLFLSILALRKTRLSYGVWCLVSVLFPITSGVLVSQARYTLVLFPIFLVLSLIASKHFLFSHIYPLVSILLMGLLTLLFVNGHWSF